MLFQRANKIFLYDANSLTIYILSVQFPDNNVYDIHEAHVPGFRVIISEVVACVEAHICHLYVLPSKLY